MKPVDIAYTWVDGGRPDYLELLDQYSSKPVDRNPERYRDPLQLLRYSLRSLHQFASPWIGTIHLITARPQVPDWLRTDHPQIRIVHHDELFQDQNALPTFNSCAIESQLHRLDCGPEFIYFNDDYLLGRPTTPEAFVDKKGRIRVFGTLLGEWFPKRIHDGSTSFGFTEHSPLWIHKQHLAAAYRLYHEQARATLHCRFRDPSNLHMERLYRYYLLSRTRARVAVPFHQALREIHFHKITNDAADQARRLQRIEKQRPTFICLNDDQRDNPNPQVIQLVQQFLERYYPNPSPWESP